MEKTQIWKMWKRVPSFENFFKIKNFFDTLDVFSYKTIMVGQKLVRLPTFAVYISKSFQFVKIKFFGKPVITIVQLEKIIHFCNTHQNVCITWTLGFHFLPFCAGAGGFWAPLCGDCTGRPELSPEYWYLAFFSDGFRI